MKSAAIECRTRARRLVSWLIGAALVAVSPAAYAQATTPAGSATDAKKRADELFQAAKSDLARGDWPKACAGFQASMNLDPSVSVLVKIARCREHEGKLDGAWKAYEEARVLNRDLTLNTSRRQELDEVIAREIGALEPRVPRIRVEVSPMVKGVELLVDGDLVARERWQASLPLDPGEHQVLVRAPKFREEQRTISVSERATVRLLVTLVPETPAVLTPVAGSTTTQPDKTSVAASIRAPAAAASDGRGSEGTTSGQRVAGFIVGGAGVVALGVAGYLGIRTLFLVRDADCDANWECSSGGVDTIQEARRTQTAGLVTAGAGSLLLAGGLVFILTAPSRHEKSRASTSSAMIWATGDVLGAQARFPW